MLYGWLFGVLVILGCFFWFVAHIEDIFQIILRQLSELPEETFRKPVFWFVNSVLAPASPYLKWANAAGKNWGGLITLIGLIITVFGLGLKLGGKKD